MTAFLASTASLDEVKIVLAGGADIIDLKNPAAGALGAWSAVDAARAVRHIAGRRRVSAAAGDATDDMDDFMVSLQAMVAAGADVVKFALGCDGRDRDRLVAVKQVSWGKTQPVAVVAVDQARRAGFNLSDPVWLAALAAAGCRGVMVDTFDKSAGRLPEIMTLSSLSTLIEEARSVGLQTGLAGSLRLADIPLIARLQPDVAGFRGALCDNDQRRGRISLDRLQRLRAALYTAGSRAARQATATAGAQTAARTAKSESSAPTRVSMPV